MQTNLYRYECRMMVGRYHEIVLMNVYILLKATSTKSPLPVLYVEGDIDDPIEDMAMNKRSGRYYRRYPWKRQNTRSRT